MPGNSKTHGHTDSNAWRPKSKMWKRRNKANGKAKSEARQTALRDAMVKGS